MSLPSFMDSSSFFLTFGLVDELLYHGIGLRRKVTVYECASISQLKFEHLLLPLLLFSISLHASACIIAYITR